MKSWKIFATGIILLFIAFTFGCSPAGAELGLVGTWTATGESFNVSGFGNETANKITLVVSSNDTGSFAASFTGFATTSMNLDFKITKGDSISKTLEIEYTSSNVSALVGLKRKYTYSINGNQLKIVGLEIWNDGNGHTATKDVTFKK
jgi:hypothetical protein